MTICLKNLWKLGLNPLGLVRNTNIGLFDYFDRLMKKQIKFKLAANVAACVVGEQQVEKLQMKIFFLDIAPQV